MVKMATMTDLGELNIQYSLIGDTVETVRLDGIPYGYPTVTVLVQL